MSRLPIPRTPRTWLLAAVALVLVVAAWPHDASTGSPAAGSPTSGTATAGQPTRSPSATGSGRASRAEPSDTPPAEAPSPTTVPSRTASTPTTIPPGTAVLTLATITVKGRAPMTGYDRSRFGQAWADVDRNGCDTRNDVLRRDLTAYVLKAGTNGCLVLRGTLHDPYTGRTISFVRGRGTSNAVQVDHVVALGDAWQKGAQRWTTQRRTQFANDPLNLLAVDGPTNLRKGDGDAATWLPPRRAERCAYVARQVSVKHAYGLWVTEAERDAMVRVLQACPRQALAKAGPIPLGGGTVARATPAAPQPTASTSAPPPGGGTDPRYGTCREAIAAGHGPYREGTDPEYAWYRDSDHDGVVCEH